MVEGRICLGALGFGLCFGLLFGFGGLLCFGIVVLVCWEVLCVFRDLRVDFGRWVEKWVESVGGVYGIRCGVSCCLLSHPRPFKHRLLRAFGAAPAGLIAAEPQQLHRKQGHKGFAWLVESILCTCTCSNGRGRHGPGLAARRLVFGHFASLQRSSLIERDSRQTESRICPSAQLSGNPRCVGSRVSWRRSPAERFGAKAVKHCKEM